MTTNGRTGSVGRGRWRRADGRCLRLFGGVESGPRPDPGDGRPAVIARADGWPLELRVWPSWPRNVPDAVRHPSGVWVALRVL